MSFFCFTYLLVEIPFSLNTLMIWSGISLILGVIILYFLLLGGKDYEPEPERLQMRPLVEDYRTRVTFHVERIDGVHKNIFQMKGLFQNNLFLLTHSNTKGDFLKNDMVLVHLSYPIGGDLLLNISKFRLNSFFVKPSKVFCVKNGGPPPKTEKEITLFTSEKDYLMGFQSLLAGEVIEGEDYSELEENEETWQGLTGLFEHVEKIFSEDELPCLMAITFLRDNIGICFAFTMQNRFRLYSTLDKIKVDSLLELLDGIRGCQDETLEISRSELFMAQSSIFRDLNENSDLLIMDEIDHEFFDKFPELKEDTQWEDEDDENYNLKETRKLKPGERLEGGYASSDETEDDSNEEEEEAFSSEMVRSDTEPNFTSDADTTKITIDPVLAGPDDDSSSSDDALEKTEDPPSSKDS